MGTGSWYPNSGVPKERVLVLRKLFVLLKTQLVYFQSIHLVLYNGKPQNISSRHSFSIQELGKAFLKVLCAKVVARVSTGCM